ncbi:MAG: RNA polymerase sigma factor [Polyangiaceae bacterium]
MRASVENLGDLAQKERGRLAAIARAEGASAEDAVDCVQEALCTFLDLDKKSDLPDAAEEWPALLAGIVKNAARNRRRRHYRARPHLEIADDATRAENEALADELLTRAEEHVRLRACVQELCTVQRAVVTLRMLEERPGEDVATALGISREYVAVLLHRAKKSLHSCMSVHL